MIFIILNILFKLEFKIILTRFVIDIIFKKKLNILINILKIIQLFARCEKKKQFLFHFNAIKKNNKFIFKQKPVNEI